MIDTIKFATTFTAFWNTTTPTCEHFIRKLNLNLYDRVDTPMADTTTEDSAFIAEFGFSLFVETRWPSVPGQRKEALEQSAREAARKRIEPLQGKHAIPETISAEQFGEVREIAQRLNNFFHSREPNIVARPVFPGCGFIDHSEGDILFGPTLYEVKTVRRNFRSNDIRQLITYCALNALSENREISNVGLFNPRRGVSFEADVNLVAREISGKSSSDLFEDIHQAISSGGISR